MENNKRVVVYMPQDTHKMLKGDLATKGMTVSEWFREQADKELRIERVSELPEKNIKKIPEIDENMLVPDKDPEYTETMLCEAPNMRCKDWATKRVHFESPEYEDMTLNFCERHLKELKKLGADILSEEDL